MNNNIPAELKVKIAKVKTIVTDVDGVLTDGCLFIDESRKETLAKFNIHDGFGVVIAHECNIKIIVISGRKSACTEARCADLGIHTVFTGVKDKQAKLQEIAMELGLDCNEMAYIGDDVVDLKAMNLVGFSVAPQNAVKIVKERVDYVTKANGGNGALRELIELVLECQGRYNDYIQKYL